MKVKTTERLSIRCLKSNSAVYPQNYTAGYHLNRTILNKKKSLFIHNIKSKTKKIQKNIHYSDCWTLNIWHSSKQDSGIPSVSSSSRITVCK